ncbi:hypothetical protein L596_005926 [Steinernema carpocapsae]|uniref:SH3 domain-containing protein n=1 Tax=Steinernema carpocapsae TaxID=34508 RepID=A0A4U8V1U7_STECR|nr:hypothetical protein L596_005926 [Steinernema carpocapsae]
MSRDTASWITLSQRRRKLHSLSVCLTKLEESPAPGRKNDHIQDVQAWEQRRSAQGLSGPAHIVPKNAETFRAVYPYSPKNADELELQPNDIVFVVEKCDDGWFIGTLLRTGQFGTFPGNYVERH